MKNSVRIWLLALGLLIFTAGQEALATVQIPDHLIYEGKKYRIFSYPSPLESYYGPKRPRPNFQRNTTANMRGYSATWEIVKGALYLKQISARLEQGTVGLDYLFPGNKGRVAATWFTGEIRITNENLLIRQPQRGLIITLKNGKVTDTKVIDKSSSPPRGGGQRQEGNRRQYLGLLKKEQAKAERAGNIQKAKDWEKKIKQLEKEWGLKAPASEMDIDTPKAKQ